MKKSTKTVGEYLEYNEKEKKKTKEVSDNKEDIKLALPTINNGYIDWKMRMEIEKLVLTDVRLPRLTCIDEKQVSPSKPHYHDHLMKFELDDARAVQIHAYLTDMALCMKTTSFVALRPSKRYLVLPRPKRFYYDAMLFHVPVAPPLPASTLQKIQSALPKDRVAAFKDMVKLTVDEVTVLYDSVSHRLASHELLKERPHDGRISLFHDLKSSSIPSLTINQLSNFYGRQLQLESKLLLLHPMMLHVLDSTFTSIPEIIMDFGVYRKLQKDYHDIQKLQELMVKDLKRAESLVTRIWYPKVIKMISKKGALGKLSKENLLKFLKCATTIISCQMTLLVDRTLDHYVDAISNEDTTPKLKLEAGVDVSEFFIYPRKRVVYKLYHSLIDIISSIGQDMPTMEVWFPDLPVSSPTYIYVRKNEMKLADAHAKLDEGLDLLFQPVEDHLKNNIENVYHVIMGTDHSKTLFRFISDSTRTYKELFERMDFYDGFHENCNWILDNVFFNVGRLYQARIQGIIKKQAGYFMNKIVTCILTKYECDYNRICSEFETLKTRALKVPRTTSELVALGNYMEFATTKFVENKRLEISKMAQVNANLLDFVLIGEENIMKISSLVNWLYNIVPIFEQYTTMFEQTKNELEDRLQKTIEKLNKDLEDIGPSLSFLSNMENTKKIFSYVQSIQTYLRKLEVFEETVVWINNEEILLKFPLTTYPELDELKSVIHPFAKLIYTCNKWFKTRKNWTNGDFEALVVENVEKTVETFHMEIFEAEKTFKLKCKQHAVDNYPRRYRGVVDDPDFNNWPAPLKLCHETLRSIKEFKPHIKIVSIMCNPALTDQHWKEMSELAQLDLTPDAGTTLQKLVDVNLESLFDQFEIISIGATKELQLQKNLEKMYSEWTSVTFFTKFLSERECYIVDGLDDIQALLDNHFVKTLSMRGSAFVKPVKDEVKHWYDMLVKMSTAVRDWYDIQEDWLHFQMIFFSPFIVSQMSGESKLFREVDYRYRKLMKSIHLDPIVIKSHQSDVQCDNLLGTLQVCLTLLQQIKHGINKYFEKKRLYFPRFFFVSNNEMLSILSQTKEPKKVQPYLNRCFEAIFEVGFDKNMNIVRMISKENEKIDFVEKICTEDEQGCVEKWLIKIESQMVASLKNAFKLSCYDYKSTNWIEWLKKWPEQAVSCMSLAYWTSNLQHCLTERNSDLVKEYFIDFSEQVGKVTELVRCSLSARERITLSSLVILHVHAKDVIKGLIDKSICSPHDFQWLSQLRYYFHSEQSEMSVCITNAKLNYSYEYVGNVSRLVITPLTERCNLTLIGAYNLHMNVAAEGPASTGKTESIKDLAKAIAIQCLNFNSNSQLDYKSLSQFFKGIASCGSWVCFDDFNRVELQVLSVVAQQMHSIMLAIRNNVKVLHFDSCELNLNPSCFVCITVNPGYVGRNELPDNLKVLFRTVAMMVPDFSLIGKILLMSYGFREAETLSVKVVTTYKLFSEQLSTQPHYEFGLRSIKTVIQNAGDLKTMQPDDGEHLLILQALINITFPQVLDEYDASIFFDIISDMFKCKDSPRHHFREEHISCIKKACSIQCVQPSDNFVNKILQTYQMMNVRHGFVLVGQPFCGKTTILRVLAEAIKLGMSKEKTVSSIAVRKLNPKAITIQQLYGYMDRTSNEWIDGIIPKLFRELLYDNTAEKKWVIFDGPVDAEWIENINTVLDDSRKLCLNSLEVIYLTSNMTLIFEVTDLTQASPATISRLGIIYVQDNCINWQCLVKSWLQSLPEEFSEISVELGDYFYALVDPCHEFIENNCRTVISAGICNSVKTMLSLVYIFMTEAFKENTAEDMKHVSLWIQASFILSVTWGLAGTLDQDSREKFDAFFKELWKEGIARDGESTIKTDLYIPSEGIVHDYFFHFKGKGQWKYWPDVLRHIKFDEMDNVLQTLIPTVDSCKYLYFIERHIKHGLPMLLAGPPCTGKSLLIKDFMMKNLPFDKYIPALMSFTTNTSARLTQQVLLSKLVKRKQGIQGPPVGRTCVIFIDDLHMPMKQDFGAQPPIELLRQFFDHGFWYDLKDLSKIQLEDILLLAAVGTAAQPVSRRFLRHFHLFSVNMLSDESIIRIFTSFLNIGYRRNGFGTDVAPIITTIVTAMLDMYHSLLKTLLPTPAKPHYLFNISDMSLVISGHLLVKKDSVDTKKFFIKLWVHEMMRVFHDRLVDQSECSWFYKQLRNTVEEHFKESFDMSLDSLLGNEEEEVTEEKLRYLFFTNVADVNSSDRKYEELNSIEQFHNLAMNALEKYNHEHRKKLNIILFDYALVHLSRMLRMLSVPGGCGLLVGPGGSGRQSLIVLAAALSSHKTFQPNIMNDYAFEDWREDLKHILMDTGGRNKSVVFIFTEYQINRDYYLEDIDVLINSGEVPNIFNVEEIQNILELVRLDAQGGNRNLDIHPLTVLSYFKSRCKDNLHIMLCLSPGGSSFRNRLLLYPSFINFCIIDWFQDWPEDALVKLSEFYLKDVDLEEERRGHVIGTCKKIYFSARDNAEYYFKVSGRKTFVTSEMYLNFIQLFADKSIKRNKELLVAKEKYENGLEKLEFAGSQVLDIKKELEELVPLLEAAGKETEQMKDTVVAETIQVDKGSALVREDEKIANIQATAANELKTECEADLAQAIPILEEAVAALNTLKPTDITLVKSMKNPPDTVKLVMAAVCVMKDIKPDRVPDAQNPGRKKLDYWGPSKRLLGDMGFLQGLKDFDKDNISPLIMQTIRKQYIPNKDFKPHIVAKASSAAEGLCKWVIAMDMYDAVAKEVAPKKAKLEIAEQEYKETVSILEEKRDMVRQLEFRLAALTEKLKEATKKKEKLQEQVNSCSKKLLKAEKLIDGLSGDKEKWLLAVEKVDQSLITLYGDMIISSALISYLSFCSEQLRQPQIENWKTIFNEFDIPFMEDYNFIEIMGSEVKLDTWIISGLVEDNFSMENAVIVDNTNRWPLFIDPQGKANEWLKETYKYEMETIQLIDSDYISKLVYCLENGKPVLLENVPENLNISLNPVLLKDTLIEDDNKQMILGKRTVTCHKDFKLFATTKLLNPVFSANVFSKMTVIHFVLTIGGLETQLLQTVMAKERPDLEEKRRAVNVKRTENKIAQKEMEEVILNILQSTGGNIIENEGAIQSLDEAKKTLVKLLASQKRSKSTDESVIKRYYQLYSDVSEYAAMLYYCLAELVHIDPLYQFSLSWFNKIYVTSIEAVQRAENLDDRLRDLMSHLTHRLYDGVCCCLFEKDCLIFSFILCTSILIWRNQLDRNEVMFLIKPMSTWNITDDNGCAFHEPNPISDWLPDEIWNSIGTLNNLEAFQDFKEHFVENSNLWRQYYDDEDPFGIKFPDPWENLSHFQKLILLRIFRADKLVPAIKVFVETHLGRDYVVSQQFDLEKSYQESSNTTPLLFIQCAGVDPMTNLIQFAEKMQYKNKLQILSLGQGQGELASKTVEKGKLEGSWVCLQNCHLGVDWLSQLEHICENLKCDIHCNFRLWLTSEPTNKLPISVLQRAIKMTFEPPTGLKQNMMSIFCSEPVTDDNFFYGCPGKDRQFTRLLFGMCFFHAVILERKNFGPIGWNIPYSFNESDYKISVQQLQMYLNDSKSVPYEAILYLTGECSYGGRVSDDWDQRTLNTLLAKYINPNMIEPEKYRMLEQSDYIIPIKYEFSTYIDIVQGLPYNPPTDVFGLHSNASISQNLQSTKYLLNAVLSVQPEFIAIKQETEKFDEMHISSIVYDISRKLPETFDIDSGTKKQKISTDNVMNIVLIQEMKRFNKLLETIRSSIEDLRSTVEGFTVLTPHLESLKNDILNNHCPKTWMDISYTSRKNLSSYICDLVKRVTALKEWEQNGIPNEYWLSGFYFPQCFLTAVLQNHARRNSFSVADLTFDFEVMQTDSYDSPHICSHGVYVHGLFIEGARWDRTIRRLREQYPKVLFDTLPLTWFKPVLKDELAIRGRYRCPIYKTTERRGTMSTAGHSSNYIRSLLLDTDQPPSHWIKRGCALLCQKDM